MDKTSFGFLALLTIALGGLLFIRIDVMHGLLFLCGLGLGISLMHAAYGFSGSWKQFILKKRSAGIRSNLLLLIVLTVLFFPLLGGVLGEMPLSAALGPVNTSVLIGAFLFGIGMQMGGGCGSGTLYTFGQGQTDMLVTLSFFIIGSTLGSAQLHWWQTLPGFGKISLIDSFGWLPALVLQLAVLIAIYYLVSRFDRKQHGELIPVNDHGNMHLSFFHRIVFGPWPLLWGVIGLVIFASLTMLLAGHPWSITFAFGLWGTKIWSALGGDISSWPYWQSGYPAKALMTSVFNDVTSIMDFGLILGAGMAATLANKFAPDGGLHWNRVMSAVIGGLLLGYGSRLAFGCNIGAMLAGITTGSLHGWLWLFAAFTGGLFGVRFRRYFDLLKV